MADFNTLIADIEAAIYENTEQAITGDALQDILLEMVTDINAAKADQGDLDDLALAVAGKADIFGTSVPLSLDDNELTLKYDDFQFDLGGDDMTLTLRLSYGLISNSIGVQVDAGDGLTFGDEGQLMLNIGEGLAFDNGALQVQASRGIFMGGNGIEANIGWGLTWDDDNEDEIAVDDTVVQPIISDLATIRSGAAAGATAVQPTDVSDCVRSATISTIVSLSQQDYDDLVDKDSATLYVII